MTAFSATFDANDLNRQLRSLKRLDQFGAFSRALSRAGQSMRKQATQEVQDELNLKSSPVREVITLRRIDRRSLSADLVVRFKAQPIYDFRGTREVSKGLSVKVKRRGRRTVIKGAFVATLRSGKTSAFMRRKDATRPSGLVWRLPIDMIFSTSVRGVLENRARQQRILSAGLARFGPELRREVTRRLGAAA